jgi:periplasmic protein TonB
MGEPPFPDCQPRAGFADVWRSSNPQLPIVHPSLRAALVLVIIVLQLSLLVLLDYKPSALEPQPAMIMVQLQNNRPTPPIKELALKFVRPHVAQITVPQFTVMPDPNPAPKSPLPVTMASTSLLSGGTSQGKGSGAGGASSCIDTAYLAEISRQIQQHFFYPEDTTGIHLQGVVYVHFTSTRMGSYQSLEVAKSSGYQTLDQAALQIMQRAAPLPMIPDRLHTDRVDGMLPIVFELKGNNLNPTWAASDGC